MVLPSSRSACHLNGKQPPSLPLKEDIAISKPRKLRVVGSGPCIYLFVAGKVRVPCTCQQGVFSIQSKVHGDEECQECTHPLSLHEDFSSSTQIQPANPATTDNPLVRAETDTDESSIRPISVSRPNFKHS